MVGIAHASVHAHQKARSHSCRASTVDATHSQLIAFPQTPRQTNTWLQKTSASQTSLQPWGQFTPTCCKVTNQEAAEPSPSGRSGASLCKPASKCAPGRFPRMGNKRPATPSRCRLLPAPPVLHQMNPNACLQLRRFALPSHRQLLPAPPALCQVRPDACLELGIGSDHVHSQLLAAEGVSALGR